MCSVARAGETKEDRRRSAGGWPTRRTGASAAGCSRAFEADKLTASSSMGERAGKQSRPAGKPSQQRSGDGGRVGRGEWEPLGGWKRAIYARVTEPDAVSRRVETGVLSGPWNGTPGRPARQIDRRAGMARRVRRARKTQTTFPSYGPYLDGRPATFLSAPDEGEGRAGAAGRRCNRARESSLAGQGGRVHRPQASLFPDGRGCPVSIGCLDGEASAGSSLRWVASNMGQTTAARPGNAGRLLVS